MFCPICGNKINTQICSLCGYDNSSDVEALPTLDKKAMVSPRSTAIRMFTASFTEKHTRLENRIKLLEDGMDEMKNSLLDAEKQIAELSFRIGMMNKLPPSDVRPVRVPDDAGFSRLKRGDIITMGKYQQEEIEWIVLSAEEHTALVISKYVLDCREFGGPEKNEGQLWAASSLREWLNGAFYGTVFSKAEQERIVPTALPDADLPHEKLFVLSLKQYNECFGDDIPAECRPTKFAEKNGAYMDRKGNTGWWLRSAGTDGNCAMSVDSKGDVIKSGYNIRRYFRGARPAMLIKI